MASESEDTKSLKAICTPTMFLSPMNHLTSEMKGGITEASRTFLMTSTLRGGLYHVSRCEAGSWIVLQKQEKEDEFTSRLFVLIKLVFSKDIVIQFLKKPKVTKYIPGNCDELVLECCSFRYCT